MKTDNATDRPAIAELADKCGITEAQATEAIDLLLDGDGRQYRRLVSDRLHGDRRPDVRADGKGGGMRIDQDCEPLPEWLDNLWESDLEELKTALESAPSPRSRTRADGPTPERRRTLDGIREKVRRMMGAERVSIVVTY